MKNARGGVWVVTVTFDSRQVVAVVPTRKAAKAAIRTVRESAAFVDYCKDVWRRDPNEMTPKQKEKREDFQADSFLGYYGVEGCPVEAQLWFVKRGVSGERIRRF